MPERRNKRQEGKFTEDHAAGLHEREIAALIEEIEPAFVGHPRAIIMIACVRIIASMLGPAADETRKSILRKLPKVINLTLAEMDRVVGR
jgi:hypothetical protein